MSGNSVGAIPFSVDISRMIELLAAQIYPSPFALLRENVQNAFDAIMLRRHAGDDFEAAINVSITPEQIVVIDNGIGMSRQQLRENFWRAGSSSKNTDAARAAGVVGTFGIGAMANFGIANRLEVVSESAIPPERTRCVAERATLSVTDDCIYFTDEPISGHPGSAVTATMQGGKPIDVEKATDYIIDFVRFVEVPVRVNGRLISQTPFEEAVPALSATWRWESVDVALSSSLTADIAISGSFSGDIRIDLTNVRINGQSVFGRMLLRQGLGAIRTFRSRFGLASASIPSLYQLGGVADFLQLQPTAGREALTTDSLAFLNQFAGPIDALISVHLASRPEANISQLFINWVATHRRWDLCGELRARVEPEDSIPLKELANISKTTPILVYAGADPAIMAHASSERPVVQLARNPQRRQCEQNYFAVYCKMEALTDDPKVLHTYSAPEITAIQAGVLFRISEVLRSDYFLENEIAFGTISHGLPILALGTDPVVITLDPAAANVAVILKVYEKEYGAIDHMTKDFVRNVIFPRVADRVPSATRQGTEAFLKTLQRTRDVFEYERSDLENLTALWKDYVEGRITMEQASARAAVVQRSYQTIDTGAMGRIRDVVPDVTEGQLPLVRDAGTEPNYEALPPIKRTDIATDRKLLMIDEHDPPLNNYRCFMALTKRILEDRGDFFLQPHRTSIVWGGQKALFIFEHHSRQVGLYYDIQMREPVSTMPGGGAFETCTIIMKNQTFIPIPEALRAAFIPANGEIKRLEVRCDLLYIDNPIR